MPLTASSPIGYLQSAVPNTLWLLWVNICFGTLAFASKKILVHWSPDLFMAVRISVAAGLFVLIAAFTKKLEWPESITHALLLALCGLLGIALNPLCFARGLNLTTSVNAILFQVLTPILTVALAMLVGQERFRWSVVLGLASAIAGVVVLMAKPAGGMDSLLQGIHLAQHRVGNLYLIANTLCFALYLVISRRSLKRSNTLNTVAWTFIFAALVLLVNLWLGLPKQTQWLQLPLAALPLAATGWLFYIIVFVTVGNYFINMRVLKRANPSLVALFILLQPLVGATLGAWILDEPLSGAYWLALILISAGLIVACGITRVLKV